MIDFTRTATYLSRVRAMTARERRQLAVAGMLLPVFWLGLHVLGLGRLRRLLLQSRPRSPERMDLSELRAIGERVNAAARHSLFPVTCLTRSLLLEWMLRAYTADVELRIGVKRVPTGLEAHAWVECAGVPVNDEANVAEKFAPFAELVQISAFRSS